MARKNLSFALVGFGSLALSFASCTPGIPDGRFACTMTSECPPGQQCASDGFCRVGGGTVDSGLDAAGSDGGPDSGRDGGGVDVGTMNDVGTVDDTGVGNDAGPMCSGTADCTDGMFCNGVEPCTAGVCGAGSSPCTGSETCNEATDTCVPATCMTDGDGDTYVSQALCGGPDCDDTSATTHPGAREACDGRDNDCNGVIDDGASANCAALPGTAPNCTAGACAYSCIGTFATCDSPAPGDSTGCETDLATSTSACGSCGHSCPIPTRATATCVASRCGIMCLSNNSNCDANDANGCETPSPTCDLDPPRLVGPTDEMLVTSNYPTFRFALAAGTSAAHVEVCMDEACSTVVWSGDGTSPLTAGRLNPGHYFWRARGRVAPTNGTRAPHAWGFTVLSRSSASPGIPSADAFPYLDADGAVADLVIGAPAMSGVGQVRLYLNGATSPGTSLGGGPAGFGSAVAAAGDVNGDGYGDIVVGSCIGIWSDTLMPTPSMGCAGGASVFLANGDGTFAAMIPITPPGGVIGFGQAVSSAGDFDGDGYADIVIGAYWSSRAYVYRGGPSGPIVGAPIVLLPNGVDPGDGPGPGMFGGAVSFAGDVNADGFDDVIVGQPNVGHVHLYLGAVAAGTITDIMLGNAPPYGSTLSGVGDFNGDGYADFAIGALGAPGMLEVRGGGPALTATTPPSVLSTFMVPPGSGNAVGSIAGFGDCDGDGLGDVVTGTYGGSVGTATIYHGGATPGMGGTVSDPTVYFGRIFGRLTSTTFTVGSCSATGACGNSVSSYTCAGGLPVRVSTWADGSLMNFGAGLMR